MTRASKSPGLIVNIGILCIYAIFGVHARLRSTEENVINPDFHTPFSALHFGAEMLSAEILT